MDKKNVWLITAKTNLHVGNESTSSYGIIDKAIQRDALTHLPCINSSSLKGAINEWANHNTILDSEQKIKIFGCDKSKKDKTTQKGQYVFFDANILAIPEQTNDNKLYKLVTCKEILDLYVKKLKALGIDITAEDLKPKDADVISEADFTAVCSDDNLPIIARNVLENGMSANLWYEQVLPAETVLIAIIDDKDNHKLTDVLNGKIVQIGANATIGYGYCEFKHL